MQVLAISKPRDRFEKDLLNQHHRLRAEVFSARLGWEVEVADGVERDAFDDLDPTYILAVQENGRVAGCARLLRATCSTMLSDVFSSLLPDGLLQPHPAMIESSRFCVDTRVEEGRGVGSIHETTLTMLAGIVEWSVSSGFSEIVTVTDLRFERILSRVGWPLQRLGPAVKIGVTTAVAGTLPADEATFLRLRPGTYHSQFSNSLVNAA